MCVCVCDDDDDDEQYVRFCDQIHERLLNCILGEENNDMNDLDFHDWIA